MKSIIYIGTLGGVTIGLDNGREILAIRGEPVSVPEAVAAELLLRTQDWQEATV